MKIPFNVRGIGVDSGPGCFVCGKEQDCYSNISGFVDSKEDGEQIVSWFEKGARLDYREKEPNWIQVKIVACSDHVGNLKRLSILCDTKYIKPEYIDMVL